MKLQKLVYYSQGWHLVFTGEPLFDSPIKAWANGPVCTELYGHHRGRFSVSESDFSAHGELSDSDKRTIDGVLAAYGDFDAHQLSELTHREKPWLDARAETPPGERSNAVIDLATMHEYYEQVLNEAQA
ncbi:Panacea domain-containing protein [Nocardia cyriacigeorgica]|nr:type II toxin-antitoxin system antitoxin SocA domain-containing protein [Nocardia cyriacigeorgica]